MILDKQNEFCTAQAVTASAASTNVIDLSEARNLGLGDGLYVVVTVDVAMTDSGSDSTVDVFLYGGTTAGATTGKQVLFTIPAVSAAGSGPYYAKISPDFVAATLAANYEFLEVYFNVNNGNLTTGSFTARLVKDIAGFQSYKKGYTIS